eukprot:gene46748-9814_t
MLERGMEEILLYGTDGTVHAETNDGGIYPSYFLDFGKPAGRDAFLSVFTDYIANGAADGRNHFIPQNNATHTPVSQQQAD